MAQDSRESVINLTDTNSPPETRAQKKARLATVLSRSLVGDRLNVPLPPDVHGEWVQDNEMALAQMYALGFKIDTEYALKHSLHNDGSGRAKIGDTVFMTCPKEHKELLDEIAHERFVEMHGSGMRKEEKNFQEQNRTLGIGETKVESKTSIVNASELLQAIPK